jgi:signal transduction histidine kinase
MAGRLGHRLHHRLFWGFGVALSAGMGTAWAVDRLVPGGHRVLAVALGGLVLWALAGAISRRLTRPVVELVEVTQALGSGELDRRMKTPPHPFNDFAVLGRAVNAMAERIETQLSDQRELLATVSHELRTPLGHLRVLLDTARERPSDPRILDELEAEVLQVDRLVDQLLATSRLDFGQLDRRPLSGAELAVRALERLGVDASLLEVEDEDTSTEGDLTLLLAAITNLVRNAEGHGGGLHRLSVRRDGGLVFEAEDQGPGFEPGTIERVFESFYRGERRAGGSLGLGLALVRRIAEAHGGSAWAADRPDGGARVGFSVGGVPGED